MILLQIPHVGEPSGVLVVRGSNRGSLSTQRITAGLDGISIDTYAEEVQ